MEKKGMDRIERGPRMRGIEEKENRIRWEGGCTSNGEGEEPIFLIRKASTGKI